MKILAKLHEHRARPEMRIGQKFLASSIVKMIHGEEASKLVEKSTEAFFDLDRARLCDMSEGEFLQYFAQTAVHKVEACPTLSGLLVQCGLRKTRAEAKRVIKESGLQVNGSYVTDDIPLQPTPHQCDELSKMLIHQKYMLLKCGKKQFALV